MKRIFGRWGSGGMKNIVTAALVGKVIQVGHHKLKVETYLAEGGYASIYRAKDLSSGELFALKHIRVSNKETVEMVRREARVMNKLKGHPNVLRVITVAFGGEQGAETDAYMLLDLCTDTLFGFLERHDFKLSEAMVLEVFSAVCSAVAEMHRQEFPLTHRDIKIENVLRRPNGDWVLCDFGSVTSRAKKYETPLEIEEEEENIRRHTTPAYRAPEMWDLYTGVRLDTRVDIWALGCLLFYLAFGSLPFSGDSKLEIMNGKYRLPAARSLQLRSLIEHLLSVNPEERPSIHSILQQVQAMQQPARSAGTKNETNSSESHSSALMSGSSTALPSELAGSLPVPVGGAKKQPAAASGSLKRTSEGFSERASHSGGERHRKSGQKTSPHSGNPFMAAGSNPQGRSGLDTSQSVDRRQSAPWTLAPSDSWPAHDISPKDPEAPHQRGAGLRRHRIDGYDIQGHSALGPRNASQSQASETPLRGIGVSTDAIQLQMHAEKEKAGIARRQPMEDKRQEAHQAAEVQKDVVGVLRLRVKELEEENKALQGQTKQLQDVIASQQQTIQEFQKLIQRQQAQLEQAAAQYAQENTCSPNASTGVLPGEQQRKEEYDGHRVGQSGIKGTGRKQDLTRESSRGKLAGVAPSRSHSSKSSKRAEVSGTDNDNTAGRGRRPEASGDSLLENADLGVSTLNPSRGNQAQQPNRQIGAEMSPDELERRPCSHRQTVSEPPPLASWHLEGF